MTTTATDQFQLFPLLHACLRDLFTSNFIHILTIIVLIKLSRNALKTERMVIGSRQRISTFDFEKGFGISVELPQK